MCIYMKIAPSTPSVNLSIHLSTFCFMHTHTHHRFIKFEVQYINIIQHLYNISRAYVEHKQVRDAAGKNMFHMSACFYLVHAGRKNTSYLVFPQDTSFTE